MLSAITELFSIAIMLRASFREPVINTVRLSDSLAVILASWLADHQSDWQPLWQSGRLAIGLADWQEG